MYWWWQDDNDFPSTDLEHEVYQIMREID
jgi:hypothetical protein